jgi:alkylhydroperoxidase/carboxymuconolactone decarboxylase family protein YurZ
MKNAKSVKHEIRQGLEMYKEYFGIQYKRPLTDLRKLTLEHLYGRIWIRSKDNRSAILTIEERNLLTVALLAAQGRQEQLLKHLTASKNLKVPVEKIVEVIIHVAHYAGWAAGDASERIVEEVYKEKGAKK